VTTNTSLAKGRDPRYLTQDAGVGHAGGTRYYTEAAGEPPGRWAGEGAAALGLAGEVDAAVMQALYMDDALPSGERLNARRKAAYRPAREREDLAVAAHLALHPYATTGDLEAVRAGERSKSRNVTPYFDFTVSAVKSVSVLHASYLVAARQARERGARAWAAELERQAAQVEAALYEAARAAVARVERAAYVRTGYHSTGTGEYRDAAGVTAALFVQHTSREGDPQLHVHIAVLNRARRADGADPKYRTLHSQMLYQNRLEIAAGTARELATRLTALGYRLTPRADGNGFEVAGVAQEVMDAFSSRRAHITPEVERLAAEYRQTYGREPSQRTLWAMGQHATLKTRRAKAHGDAAPAIGESLTAWEARTTEREVAALSSVHRAAEAAAAESTEAAPSDLAPEHRARIIRVAVANVQRSSAAWTRAQLAWEIHRAMPAMAAGMDQAALAQDLVDAALSGTVDGADVLRLGPGPDVTDVSELGVRASDGQSVYRPPGAERFTTTGQLDLEEYLLTEARREVPQRVEPDAAVASLADTDLDETQREVAAGLLTSRRAVEVLVAPAGTGKTHVVAAFARAWTAWTGRRVIGLTMSTNAARVMAAEGLAEAYNTAQFLGKLPGTERTRGAMHLSRDDVLVVDETSQVSTDDLAKIQAVASAAGARVVLVGDSAQLGAVEAAGMMRLIAETLGHWELFEVRRFGAEWERDASLGLRRGECAAWAEYDAHGRARGGPQDKAQAEAVALWLADYLLGRDALLLAGSNDEAAELARQARERLVKLGHVPARPEVHLSDGNGAAVGDVVRARLNTNIPVEAGDALTNRDTLRLAGFGGQAPYRYALAERKTPEGWTRPFPVPVSYLENHAELAYAGNVAVSQGRTVDVAHLLVSPTLSRESFYVGMTRGRLANTAHVVTGAPQPRTGNPLPQAEVEAVVADILATESASLTATEVMRQGQDAPVNSRHVFAMWSTTTRAAAYAAIDEGLRDRLAPAEYQRYLAEPQRPVFQRRVREAELSGRDLQAVLDVAAGESMRGARSIAAVMHGRLKAAQMTGAGQTVTWAERTPAASRQGLGGRLADHLDARAAELGRAQAVRPEPWLLRHLGPPPGPDASAALRADYEHRAAVAASYREAAGITDPDVSLGEIPRGVPELAASWRAAAHALEIPDELAAVRGMSRADLEALTARYEQVQRAAPVEVSGELRAAELRAADLATAAAEADARGLTQEAADHRFAADVESVHATKLTGRHEVYRSWQDLTAPERHEAELAAAELARRKAEPETGDQADAREREPKTAPERKVRPSLWEQVQADLANLEALEAKLNRDVAEARAQAEAEALEAAAELAAKAPADSVPENQANAAEVYGRTSVHEPEPAPREPEAEARSERIDAHLTELEEAQAAQAARAASRDTAGVLEAQAEAVAETAGAWVPGREAPGYEAAPAAEAEAGL